MHRFFCFTFILLLSACSDLGYYWNMTQGHLSLMNKRVDIDDMLEQPNIDADLKQRLQLIQQIRAFSVDRLALPESASYSSYVQLDRPYVLQNLFAASEFSTQLHRWCYPIVGCTSYRGYYDEERLKEYVEQLKTQGFDTHIGYVPAYSTLGWFDDPVLSSFIDWPDYRVAGLLFHELTHQRLFIDDDTQFNESLAVAVQLAGTELWLKSVSKDTQMGEFRRWIEYRRKVVSLIVQTRENLSQLYQTESTDAIKREKKQAIFAASRESYSVIADNLNYKGGYKNWFAGELNNAKIGSVSAYNTHAPAFLAMISALDYDFSAFFEMAYAIGAMDRTEREHCLALWKEGKAINDDRCANIAPA
jgi:predicted aminopeptidase